MCTPSIVIGVVGAVVSIATTVASGVMQADAAGAASKAAAKDAENQAAAALERKQIKEKQRLDALVRGGQEAAVYGAQGRRVAGAAKAAMAKSGFAGGEGFAGQARYLAGLDARKARSDAAAVAWGFDIEAKGQARTARAFKQRATAARRAGFMGQTAIMLGTAGSVAGQTISAAGTAYERYQNYKGSRKAAG